MGSDEAMERDDRPTEGLMELVLPGSRVFDDDILPPLHNSYLYDDSRKSFLYSSAHLINNEELQTRYAAFRTEKRECGYTEKELEETFGFLLFDDESKATELGERGLLTGHSTCSTLGDPSKGVYVSKYSDCLDLKPWYSGKSGHIAIMKLIKGRVKEVTENYTLKFTPPTPGFDTHESEQIKTVTAATSSFLAFERTQYYVYEVLNGGEDTEKCPRHVYPFAIVEFSYGKAETDVPEIPEESDEKAASSFDYRPWTGQLAFDSFVLDIGLKSQSGALIPAKLPETLSVKTVMRVADLKASLPKEVFETCFSGDIFVGGRYCSLYEVISTDEDDNSSLYLLTDELKDKELALVFLLSDSGVFAILHSSYFLSYEDGSSEETEALYGLFTFPDSHTIQTNSLKTMQRKSALSSRVSRVLPALTYAETEVEKLGSDHHREIQALLEQHLKNYGTLIQPGMQNSPQREASMFPDQYDVPCVFKQLYPLPKWTEVARMKVMMYFEDPCSLEIPVKRVSELISKNQNRDDPDDEVYYYISSPEPEEALSAETTADQIDSSLIDILPASDSTDDLVLGVSSGVTRSAATSEDPLKTNAEEFRQKEQEIDSLLVSVSKGADSPDGQSPEHDYADYPEDSPMSLPPAGDDQITSDTEDAPGTPLTVKKPLQGTVIDNSGGVNSVTVEDNGRPVSSPTSESAKSVDLSKGCSVSVRTMEDNGRPVSSPTSESVEHAKSVDLSKGLSRTEEAACSSEKLLEPTDATDSTTKVSKDSNQKMPTSKLKQSPGKQSVVECKPSMGESTSNKPIRGQTELALEGEVGVPTSHSNGEKPISDQSDQVSTPSKGQNLLDAVDSVPLPVLPAELSSTTKDKDSHTDKTHRVVDIVDPEELQAEAEVTNTSDNVSDISVSTERLIKSNGQDNVPSDQKLNEDPCKSSGEETDSSPCGISTDEPSASEGNSLTAASPAVILSSTAVSMEACESEFSETVKGPESEEVSDKKTTEKPPEVEDSSERVDSSEKSSVEIESEKEDSSSEKLLQEGTPIVDGEKDHSSSVDKSKSSTDKVPTTQPGVCSEKPVDSQVTSVSSDKETPALPLSVSSPQIVDQGNSVEKHPDTSQPAEQQQQEDAVLVTNPGKGTSATSASLTPADHDKGVGGDLQVTKSPPTSDAVEVKTDNGASQVGPKPCIQLESGTEQPLDEEGTEGDGSLDANGEDKASVKPQRRRGRRRKRVLSFKPKTTTKQQTSQGISPLALTKETPLECGKEIKKQTSLENDPSTLSKQKVDMLRTHTVDLVDKSVSKSVPLEYIEHNYSQSLKETPNQKSETSAEKSLFRRGKDGLTLYQRNKTQQRKSASQVGVEIIIESKQVHRLKRRSDIDSLNYNLKTVITDCGKVFVPHGTEMPQDVEVVRKRTKSAEGPSRTRPDGLGSPTEWGDESRRSECLTRKDTKHSLSLSPGSRTFRRQSQESGEYSPKNKNVSACQVTPTDENPSGHEEDLESFPTFVLELDNNNPTQVTEHDKLIGRTDETPTDLSFKMESSTKTAGGDSEESSEQGNSESDAKGGHKAKRKRSATYTVIPISELKTVFRAGKRSISSGPDDGGLKSDSKRHKGNSEDMGKESALGSEIVPSSELASTSTKKHNKLLKKWQKISSTDIFSEGSFSSSDPLSFICHDDLQGSDDGILVQIQLDSADNNNPSEAGKRKARARRPEEAPLGGSSSRKKARASNFRRQREIVQKGESIEVSRLWKEEYDFGLDSKFRKNPRDETVLRALHGPWDFNIKDSEEEIHLIFHMWIGLFYSKSAPRFFHLDSDFFPPEEEDVPISDEGAKSPRDVHLQLSSITDFPLPKTAVTSALKFTTTLDTDTSAPFDRFRTSVLLPSDERLMMTTTTKGSDLQTELRPESPSSYEVLDLSLKSCKASDLSSSSTPDTVRVEAPHSDAGVEQLDEEFNEGPLDLRIEPVKSTKVEISEVACGTESTADECTNTTVDAACTSTVDAACTSTNIACQSDLSEKAKVDFFDRLREDQNPVVTQDNEKKYRFFILETSDDAFFRETREHLEADGHSAVEPDQFDLDRCSPSSPLLIIMRNQDIAQHICEIPHLLELKTSPGVIFAGVDRPDDIRNLTHEELFSKGGFLMHDTASLKKLTLESMKRTVDFLTELSRKGKWKWYLHYRDSRGLREEARTNKEARDKKHFLDSCQEAGLVEVLPYHDCDVISEERPDYLHCLVRLQVQNATKRFPVFMTDTTEESFKRSGIFTLTDTFWI